MIITSPKKYTLEVWVDPVLFQRQISYNGGDKKSNHKAGFSFFKGKNPELIVMTLKKNDPLRLDVSYLVKNSPGTYKEFEFNFPQLVFSPEFSLVGIAGKIKVSTTEDGVVAEGNLTALTELACSRCLDDYWQPLKMEFTEIFLAHPLEAQDADLGEQPLPADGSINLTPILRDYASLEIPIRQVCRNDCKGLCPSCGGNLNQKDCGHRQEQIDPRFEGLQALLEKDEE